MLMSIFIIWYIIGFCTLLYDLHNIGSDLTVNHLLGILIMSLLGPIIPILYLICKYEYKLRKIGDKVLLKGK